MCPSTAFSHSDDPGTSQPQAISRDVIPSSTVSQAAFELASSLLSPAILNHSIRVYLYAKTLVEQSESVYYKDPAKHDLLFTACILHDIGTMDKFDGPQRFEVEGADSAVNLLRDFGVKQEEAHEVWMAIALHTSPGIAERINELSRLVREAVRIDFGRKIDKMEGLDDMKKSLEEKYPRLGVERVLGDAVVQQAVRNPAKAPPASWPNNLYKAHLAEPEWQGVNKGF